MDSLGCRATSCSRELAAQGTSSLTWLTRFKLLFSRVQHHCGVYTSASQCAQVQYTSLHGDKQNWINYCCLHKIATGDIKKKLQRVTTWEQKSTNPLKWVRNILGGHERQYKISRKNFLCHNLMCGHLTAYGKIIGWNIAFVPRARTWYDIISKNHTRPWLSMQNIIKSFSEPWAGSLFDV